MDIDDYLTACKEQIDRQLDLMLPPETTQPVSLHQAMRYSVLNGGKRIRSALIFATGEALAAKESVLQTLAVAVEMIHAYSLIHDDLPALDNDDLRRGVPSCHIAFGESTAILAGDALQSYAFELIASIKEKQLPAAIKVEMIQILAHAIGSKGMIGGEEMDIRMVNTHPEVAAIEQMYLLKTGYLISASVLLGALSAQCCDKSTLNHLRQFAECMGISFQIHDDIIGIESDTQLLGKKQNADLALHKPVYPLVVGMISAKQRRDTLYHRAMSHLNKTTIKSARIIQLADYIIKRTH